MGITHHFVLATALFQLCEPRHCKLMNTQRSSGKLHFGTLTINRGSY
jgi:hypothetical protein